MRYTAAGNRGQPTSTLSANSAKTSFLSSTTRNSLLSGYGLAHSMRTPTSKCNAPTSCVCGRHRKGLLKRYAENAKKTPCSKTLRSLPYAGRKIPSSKSPNANRRPQAVFFCPKRRYTSPARPVKPGGGSKLLTTSGKPHPIAMRLFHARLFKLCKFAQHDLSREGGEA